MSEEKMSFPKKLIIAGVEWKILVCEKPSDVDMDGRHSLWGQTSHWQKEIRIYKRNKNAMWQTLFHELFHVWFAEIEENKMGKNEKLISRLGSVVYDTLARNKILK